MSYLIMQRLDLLVVVFYFVILIGNGLYQSMRKTKAGDDFLLGGKAFGVFSTLCTQGATMKGSGALLGYSAGAFSNGTGVLISSQCYSLGAWIAVLSGIARKVKRCSEEIEIRSSGDIFNRRFDSRILKNLAGLGGAWMALSILSGQMAALGLLIHLMFGKYGLNYETSLIIGVAVAIVYTAIGGLVSVVYNDVFQWLVMTPLIFLIFPATLVVYGGATPTALHSALDAKQFFSLQPNIWWLGYLLGGVLAACCDVSHLTRFITAKNEKTAVKGSMLGFAYCTLLAGFVVFFGLSAAMLVDPAVVVGNTDGVLLALVSQILPVGLVGLFVSAVLATTISTLDSNLQTSVLCIMVDVVEPILPKDTPDKQRLFYCRVITLIIAVISIFIVLKMKNIVPIMGMGFNVYASAIFFPLMSCMFWTKATGKGCLAGILSGGIMAIVAVLTKLPLPIVWGVGVSAVLTTSVSLVTGNSMNLRPLLPGFNESLPIDRQIFAACTFGALGTLLLSIGVGMWVNWPCVFLGVAGLWICIVMIDQAFKKYETEMRGATV